MNILYETNSLGYLGWIIDLPGAYIRGKTLADARLKISQEIKDYDAWLEIQTNENKSYVETIKQCDLHVEDADSNVIFDIELEHFKDINDFSYWCNKAVISGRKAEELYNKCRHKEIIDPKMVRKTFYGDVYSTINGQFKHIVDVQNYYLCQIHEEIDVRMELAISRVKFVEQLKTKYAEEGNKLYHYDEEDWTIRKIIRRIIWHDRIHSKAIERMEKRLEETNLSTNSTR